MGGEEQRHPEGAYCLEWREGGKRGRQSVGRDAAAASARRHRQQQILGSKAAGIKLVDEDRDDGLSLAEAVAGYLEDGRISKKPKSSQQSVAASPLPVIAEGSLRTADLGRQRTL
jgi:hypothetical protein